MRINQISQDLRSGEANRILTTTNYLLSGKRSIAWAEKHFDHLLEGIQGLTPGVLLNRYLGEQLTPQQAQMVTLGMLSATGRLIKRKSLTLHAHETLLGLQVNLPALERLTIWQLKAEHLPLLEHFIENAPQLRRIYLDQELSAEVFEAIIQYPKLYQMMGEDKLVLKVLKHQTSLIWCAQYLLNQSTSKTAWKKLFKKLTHGVVNLKPGKPLQEFLGDHVLKDTEVVASITLALLQVTGELEKKRTLTIQANPYLLNLTPRLDTLKTLNIIGLTPCLVEPLVQFVSEAPKLKRLELDQVDQVLYQTLINHPKLINLLGNLSIEEVMNREEEQVTEASLTALFTSQSASHIYQAITLGLLVDGNHIGAHFKFAEILQDSQISTLKPGSRLRKWLRGREPILPDGSRVSDDLVQLVLLVLARLTGALSKLDRLTLQVNDRWAEFEVLSLLEDDLLKIPHLELSLWTKQTLIALQHTPRLLDKLLHDHQHKAQELKTSQPHLKNLALQALANEELDTHLRSQLIMFGELALGEEVTSIIEDRSNSEIHWRFCPAGRFSKLSNLDKNSDQQIMISRPLLVSKTHITEAQWSAVMNLQCSKFISAQEMPTEKSWLQGIEFCNRLSELHHLTPVYQIDEEQVSMNWSASGYRFLSEAEWEYVARAGEDYEYAGSQIAGHVAWALHNSRSRYHPVAQKSPNSWGLYDCSGNLYDLCQDSWAYQSDQQSVTTNHLEVDPVHYLPYRNYVVIRGGYWRVTAARCSIEERRSQDKSSRFGNGLRIARALS